MNNEEKDASNVEDQKLIGLFLSGKSNAFDKIVLKYQDQVYNLCCRMIANEEDATDCAQETFVKVFRSLHQFKSQSRFFTWLYRIAVNVCKNKLSSKAYKKSQQILSIDEPDKMREIQAPDMSYDSLEKKDRYKLLERAISQLSEEHKALLLLFDHERLSYEEIQNITGLKLGTIKSRLARAREMVKKILEKLNKDNIKDHSILKK